MVTERARDNEWVWSNTAGEQGRLHVSDIGSLIVQVDDDHYSGLVPPDKARELGRELLLGNIHALCIPSLPLEPDRAEHLRALQKQRPTDYRYEVDGQLWLVPAAPRFTFLRTLILGLALRLKIYPATLSMMLMEIAAALVGLDLSREDFVKNAEIYHDSVRLAFGPKMPAVNTKGGEG